MLIALLYRLTMLQLASRILPTIGADSWESEEGVDNGWDDRPVLSLSRRCLSSTDPHTQTSTLTRILLTYRQSIFITVYSHLLRASSRFYVASLSLTLFKFSIILHKSGGGG